MAIMTTFSGSDKPYNAWYVQNCGGYEITIDETQWSMKQRFADFSLFGEQGEDEYSLGDNKE